MDKTNTMLNNLYSIAMANAEIDQREAHVIEILNYYLSKRPTHHKARMAYAECLRLVGRYDDAMDAFLQCLEIAPENKKHYAYGRLGFLCTIYKSPAEAEVWYKLACNSDGVEGWVWLLRGINILKIGDFNKALDYFDEAKNYDDIDRSEIALNKGLTFRAMGRYDDAIAAFYEAIKEDNNYEEAKKCLNELQDLNDTLDIIRNNRHYQKQ